MYVCGACVASQLIDRIGRKVLLIASYLGCATALSFTCTCTYFQWNLVSNVGFLFFYFMAAIGMLTVPNVYVIEIFPQKVK